MDTLVGERFRLLPCPEAGLASVAARLRIAGLGVTRERRPPDLFVARTMLGKDIIQGRCDHDKH